MVKVLFYISTASSAWWEADGLNKSVKNFMGAGLQENGPQYKIINRYNRTQFTVQNIVMQKTSLQHVPE